MISQAIKNLAPTAEWTLAGSSITWEDGVPTNLFWHSDNVPVPTKEAINAEVARLEQEWINTEYQRKRADEYPTIKSQLDMLYHDAVEGTTTWQDAVQAVKTKYPKPE